MATLTAHNGSLTASMKVPPLRSCRRSFKWRSRSARNMRRLNARERNKMRKRKDRLSKRLSEFKRKKGKQSKSEKMKPLRQRMLDLSLWRLSRKLSGSREKRRPNVSPRRRPIA